MFRIGIVGSDNSHAEIFSKLVNLPDKDTGELMFPDCRVTCIFGLDEERTRQVAGSGRIEFVAERPEDFAGKVDAVMVVFRHGDLHARYALPFIEAGIPVWVDKPFSIKNEDALMMIKASEKSGAILTGGSTCKYSHDIQTLKSIVRTGSTRIGRIRTAVMNFPATLENEYGGIYFYGAHLAEMAMMVFGHDARSVVASESGGVVTAVVRYDQYQVTLNFIPGSEDYYAVLHGEKGTMFREIDISTCYIKGFGAFADMLRTKKPPLSFEQLYAPVELLNAVMRSCASHKEESLFMLK